MNTIEIVIKKPGEEHWPVWYYEQVHGDLETNGKKQLGHYRTQDKSGQDIVVLPDAPITRVE